MEKKIAIIGGGISGLTSLHYLKQRLGRNAQITLYERESFVGGTIRTLDNEGSRFETGPNGFFNQPVTLQLIQEIGLLDEIVEADSKSKSRYIQVQGELLGLPIDLMSFVKSPLLSLQDKFSLVAGFFKKNVSADQSIYDYVSKRFNANIAERLADPFITGIYAGNIQRLHMASAFPKWTGNGKNKQKRKAKPKTKLCSFKGGMGQLIDALYMRYQEDIKNNSPLNSLSQMDADIFILSTPAYVASQLLKNLNPSLAATLEKIHYAPIAVVGLVFDEDSFKRQPEGFGYLIPSKEQKDVLGVLIESNIYPERNRLGQTMIRVMLGGDHNPSIINTDQEKIFIKAIKEIDQTYGLTREPIQRFVKVWPKGIPQYDLDYPQLKKSILEDLKKTPQIYLCANYLGGISFNDCVSNAKSLAESISL